MRLHYGGGLDSSTQKYVNVSEKLLEIGYVSEFSYEFLFGVVSILGISENFRVFFKYSSDLQNGIHELSKNDDFNLIRHLLLQLDHVDIFIDSGFARRDLTLVCEAEFGRVSTLESEMDGRDIRIEMSKDSENWASLDDLVLVENIAESQKKCFRNSC